MALVDVVKYDGDRDVFAWKYPDSELTTLTQLIVNESQEAVLYKGGKCYDVFESGRHTLTTANIPIINNLINLPFGGRSPFSAEVWYINKLHTQDIKWGTRSPMQLQDPKYGIFIPVRAFGQFGIQIDDSVKFLTKVIGTIPNFDKENVKDYFKGIYLTIIKDAIATYIVKQKISILEISSYLQELSDFFKDQLSEVYNDYGIRLIHFSLNSVNIPEDDAGVAKLKDALAKKAEMDIIGYTYAQERSFDTMEGAAKNEGGGHSGMMGTGIGLGMGVTMGNTFGSQMGGVAQHINTNKTKPCRKCGTPNDMHKRFCHNCGNDNHEDDISDLIVCSGCGKEFSHDAKFCKWCGDPYNPCKFCGHDLGPDDKVCGNCSKPVPLLVNCPTCSTEIANELAKFCNQCGTSLAKSCPSCETEITDGQKFCMSCGQKL